LQEPCIQRYPEVPYLVCNSLASRGALFARALAKEHQTDCDMKETRTPNKRQKNLTKWLSISRAGGLTKREKEAKEAKEGMQRQPCYALSTLLQYEAVRRRTGAGACSSEGEATACRPKSAAVHTDICLGCSKSTVCRVFLNCRAACKNSQNPQFFEFSGRMRKQWEWDIESSMNDGVCA